jgi:hypothetical protein
MPAASNANIIAIKKRSIREAMIYILLDSVFKAGMGASVNI